MIVNSALLLTGRSKSGKTSLIATAAEWLNQHFGGTLRLYTADGGGFGDKMDTLIEIGIVEVFRLRTRTTTGGEGLTFETLIRSSQGWWPAGIDPRTGAAPPGGPMLAPVSVRVMGTCPKGHTIIDLSGPPQPLKAVQCFSCGGAIIQPQQMVIDRKITPNPGFERVMGYAFEGLTSYGDWLMADLSEKRANLELVQMDTNIGRFMSGEIAIDGNAWSDYSKSQASVEQLILNSTALANMKIPPIWTGLESRGQDNGSYCWYPDVPGKAASGKVPQWCGHWLGARRDPIKDKTGKQVLEHFLHFNQWVGPDGIPHDYSTRCEPGVLPDMVSDEGVPFSKFSLGYFFDLIEAAAEARRATAMQRFPNAPGLPQPIPLPAPPAPTQQPATSIPRPRPAVPGPRPVPPRPAPFPARPPSGPPKPVTGPPKPAAPTAPPSTQQSAQPGPKPPPGVLIPKIPK